MHVVAESELQRVDAFAARCERVVEDIHRLLRMRLHGVVQHALPVLEIMPMACAIGVDPHAGAGSRPCPATLGMATSAPCVKRVLGPALLLPVGLTRRPVWAPWRSNRFLKVRPRIAAHDLHPAMRVAKLTAIAGVIGGKELNQPHLCIHIAQLVLRPRDSGNARHRQRRTCEQVRLPESSFFFPIALLVISVTIPKWVWNARMLSTPCR